MSEFLIYALVDPTSNKVRYIGKSTVGLSRPRAHLRLALAGEKGHKANWIRSLCDSGFDYRIVALEELATPDLCNEREIAWIAYGRQAGWPLTNATDGGDGVSSNSWTDEMRAKISKAQSGKVLSPAQYRALMDSLVGVPKSGEHRRKISAALKSREWSEEEIEAKRASARSRKGRWKPSPGHLAKLAAANARRKAEAQI